MGKKLAGQKDLRETKRYSKILLTVLLSACAAFSGIQAVSAATLTVSTTADNFSASGQGCSLREAIEASNQAFKYNMAKPFAGCGTADPAGNTIVLAPSAVPYKIGINPGQTTYDNSTGSFTILSPITIKGNGAVIDGGLKDRVFEVTGSKEKAFNVAIDGVTIQNGLTSLGGAGIEVILPGGGAFNLSNSIIQNNKATAAGGGGLYTTEGQVKIENSVITTNISPKGAGILNQGGFVTLDGATVIGNVTTMTGANEGGGIANTGRLYVFNSTLAFNVASGVSGGGIANNGGSAKLKVYNSTISNNYAGTQGGGIYNALGEIEIVNTTITGNHAAAGSIYVPSNVPVSVKTFLAQYSAGGSPYGHGGGITHFSGTATLKNSIVAGNSDDGAPNGDKVDFNCMSPFTSSSNNNLIGSDGGCSFSAVSNQKGVLAKLDPLALNGSPFINVLGKTWMMTHTLQAGSPAIDKGDSSACALATSSNSIGISDQIGNHRISGVSCDLGALESASTSNPNQPKPQNSGSTTGQGTTGSTGTTPATSGNPIQPTGTGIGIGVPTPTFNDPNPTSNKAPVAADDNYSVVKNSTLIVNAANGLLKNDSDPDNNPKTVVLSSILKPRTFKGTLSVQANGSFTYTPDKDSTGSFFFTYRISDGLMTSANTAKVTLTVSPTATQAPEQTGTAGSAISNLAANPDSYSIYAGKSVSNNVTANDEFALGAAITAKVTTQPSKGTLQLNTDGSFTYTAKSTFTSGTDVFQYTIQQGGKTSSAASVTFTALGSLAKFQELVGGQTISQIQQTSGQTATPDQTQTTTSTTQNTTSTNSNSTDNTNTSTSSGKVYPPEERCLGFIDISVDDPMCDAQFAIANQVGFTRTNFDPEARFTRAEAIKIIDTAFGEDFIEGYDYCKEVTPFIDAMPGNHWSAQRLCRQKKIGSITGYRDHANFGKYLPDGRISNAELATILLRYTKVNDILKKIPLNGGQWYINYWNYVLGKNLSSDKDPGRLLNRLEALDMLYRFSKEGLLPIETK